MRLPIFGKSKQDDQAPAKGGILLALDIGTEFVKAVLFRVDDADKKVEIVGYGKSRQHSAAMSGAMIVNIENVISACDRSIGAALHNADATLNKGVAKDSPEYRETPVPEEVIMGIAGELVRGVSIMADYEREDNDEKITREELELVIDQIKEQAFAGAIDDIADEIGVPSDKLEEINSKISATYIDNKRIDNPIGFTGLNVSYKIFATFAPSLHVNSLKEIAQQLGLHIVSIEVEPFAIARAIKGARSDSYSSIIIDIGGGTTDVAVIDRGTVMGTKMFAYGGKVFTKRISEDLRVDLHEAEAMKIKHGDKGLTESESKQIRKALLPDIKVWSEGVEIALEEIEDVEQYPTQIYICGGGSALPEIKEGLMEYSWLQVLPFLKHPKVEHLFPGQLEDIVDLTGKVIAPEDVAPVALARMILDFD